MSRKTLIWMVSVSLVVQVYHNSIKFHNFYAWESISKVIVLYYLIFISLLFLVPISCLWRWRRIEMPRDEIFSDPFSSLCSFGIKIGNGAKAVNWLSFWFQEVLYLWNTINHKLMGKFVWTNLTHSNNKIRLCLGNKPWGNPTVLNVSYI